MQHIEYEQAILDFYTYPPVGTDDWRYLSQTALVRMLELQMLSKAALLDMANAENFEQASDLLSSTEYALPPAPAGSKQEDNEMENILLARRYALRQLFADLILDKQLVHFFKTPDDFANLRLALRRTLTGKPVGRDYSNDGNVPPELFEQIFSEEANEAEEADKAAKLPDYMQQAADQATLDFYKNKDIRQIDYAIDNYQSQYNLEKAHRLKSIFLLGLFRIQIDLTNIRTMFRLKFTQSQDRFQQDKVFLKGGYLTLERLKLGLDAGYESLGQLFFVTPYWRVVEAGASYLTSSKSFLKLEQQCEEHLTEFLKSTIQIITGTQPIIAYLLMKENEIRTVRLILTAKKNFLDTKLILDRIS